MCAGGCATRRGAPQSVPARPVPVVGLAARAWGWRQARWAPSLAAAGGSVCFGAFGAWRLRARGSAPPGRLVSDGRCLRAFSGVCDRDGGGCACVCRAQAVPGASPVGKDVRLLACWWLGTHWRVLGSCLWHWSFLNTLKSSCFRASHPESGALLGSARRCDKSPLHGLVYIGGLRQRLAHIGVRGARDYGSGAEWWHCLLAEHRGTNPNMCSRAHCLVTARKYGCPRAPRPVSRRLGRAWSVF